MKHRSMPAAKTGDAIPTARTSAATSAPRRRLLAAGAGLLPAALSPTAFAQADKYPSKPIRMVVSSPPGSTFDAISRAACTEAEKKLGQPFVFDYKSGAGGTPAFVATRGAAPDGYTLALLSISTIRQPILENVGYDGAKDFTWIANLTEVNFGVLVQAESPFRSWADLLAFGRANPQKVSYGAPSGLGNSAHLFTAQVANKEKLEWAPVPFRASNDCMVALLSGQLTFSVDTLISAAPQVQAGKARFLAMATRERVPKWPDVPTMRELGYPLSIDSPVGIGGPPGLPADIVQTVQDAFRYATEQPGFVALLDRSATRPKYMNAIEFRTMMERAEVEQRELLTTYGFAKKR